MNSVIILPRLHANNSLGKVCEVIESARHRAEDTRDTFLTRHTGANTNLGPTTSAAAERIDTAPCSRHSHRASDIRADTNTAALGKKSGFTAGGTTGAVLGDMGVAAVAPETIGRFK